MKTVRTISLLFALALAFGCCPGGTSSEHGVGAGGLLLDVTDVPLAQAGDLSVTAEVSAKVVERGQSVTVIATVTNNTEHSVRIDSPDERCLVVEVWRHTARGWTAIFEYPELEFAVVSSWGLAGRSQYTQTIEVPIEPTWPTHEALRLVVDVNGAPAESEPITITALP